MKFTTSREALLKAINFAQEIITNKSPVSILSNVLLQTAENKVIVKCTNSTVKAITSFGAEIEEEGELTIFCDKFLSIINSLPMGDVEVFNSENEVIIQPLGKRVRFKLKSLAADKFPLFNKSDGSGDIKIASKDFKNLIRNTIFAVSTDQNRYFLTGCYVCKDDETKVLNMIATDGRRMSICKSFNFTADIKAAIIPTKILYVVDKFMNDEGDLIINCNGKEFTVKSSNIEISTTLIDGQFPAWQKVVPSGLDRTITVDKSELEDAIKRAVNMSARNGRIQLFIDKGKIEISSPENEIGSSKEEISADYNGESVNISLNVLYLSDVLKILNTDKISIDFSINEDNKVSKALIIRESDKTETSYTHIVMPMSF